MNESLFVYRCLSCGRVYLVTFREPLRCPCGSKDREHTASIDPRLWVESLANAEAKEQQRMVKELREGVKA